MQRALFACTTIVAAFQLRLVAASPLVEEAPIEPAVASLAAQLELDPARDPARFMAAAAQLLYPTPEAKPPAVLAGGSPAASDEHIAVDARVPVPLTAAVWSRAIFRRTVRVDQLVAAILADRRAALLCRGLAGSDDETLAYFSNRPALLTLLYEHAAGTFAAFGDSFQIRGGRVVTPGGQSVEPLWEDVVQAPLSDPNKFARGLFLEFGGRLAYLFDLLASVEPDMARFALGAWIEEPALRASRFRALAQASIRGYHEWHPEDHPFTRPLGDLGMLLVRVRLGPTGVPVEPSSRAFWGRVYDVAAEQGDSSGLQNVDAAWLISATAGEDMQSRVERLDQFAFAQRVFGDIPGSERAIAANVVRGFGEHRLLLLTLDRLGIRTPATYRTVVECADRLDDQSSSRRFWTLGAFEGSLAIISGLARGRTIEPSKAESLVVSLSAVPLEDGDYQGGIARWVREQLSPVLPQGSTWEERVAFGLAGSSPPDVPPLNWEGETYRLDVKRAERLRLAAIREKQSGYTLDVAFAIDALAHTLRASRITLEDVGTTLTQIRALTEQSASRFQRPFVAWSPPGVQPFRDGHDVMVMASTELSKIAKTDDLRRAARVGVVLQQLADVAFGEALVSFAYALDLGDPDSAALLAGNVALRHDFGFAKREGSSRRRTLWAVPRQDIQPGVPWHISGSLLGLDLALAPLTLRRLTLDRMAEAPKLASIERETLAVSVGWLDPWRLTDDDRDEIAAAIARGRDHVDGLATRRTPMDGIVDRLGLSGRRRRALEWAVEHEPSRVRDEFSLSDLLVIGRDAQSRPLDAWGTPALYSEGCLCTRLPGPRAWRILEGRALLPMMAATMGDLTLAMAVMLHDLNVPAALLRPVMALGMQDFIDELQIAYSTDWRGLSREAQAVSRHRVEDYVSDAAAVDGPLVPDEHVADPPR